MRSELARDERGEGEGVRRAKETGLGWSGGRPGAFCLKRQCSPKCPLLIVGFVWFLFCLLMQDLMKEPMSDVILTSLNPPLI